MIIQYIRSHLTAYYKMPFFYQFVQVVTIFLVYAASILSAQSANGTANATVSLLTTSAAADQASNSTDLDELDSSALIIHNLTNLDLSSPTTPRSPPPFFDVSIPVNTIYNFTCNTTEFPMLWILGHTGHAYRYAEKPNLNLTVCYQKSNYVKGCPFYLAVAHKCTGAMYSCSMRIDAPDAAEGCEAIEFTLRYQCVPAPTMENPLKPFQIIPGERRTNDPCDAYYQRKNENLGGNSSASAL